MSARERNTALNRIKEIRAKTGLSQTKFGEKFHIAPANIQMWEQGVNNPTEYTMYMIERILELEGRLETKESANKGQQESLNKEASL